MTNWVEGFQGAWVGPSTLYLQDSTHDSDSEAHGRLVQQGQFFELAYTWEFENEPQEGFMLIPVALADSPARAAWLDTFHMRGDIWVCKPGLEPDGRIALRGFFSYPPGPDWGWRIELGLEQEVLALRMFIITPHGEESPAVRADYRRAG